MCIANTLKAQPKALWWRNQMKLSQKYRLFKRSRDMCIRTRQRTNGSAGQMAGKISHEHETWVSGQLIRSWSLQLRAQIMKVKVQFFTRLPISSLFIRGKRNKNMSHMLLPCKLIDHFLFFKFYLSLCGDDIHAKSRVVMSEDNLVESVPSFPLHMGSRD